MPNHRRLSTASASAIIGTFNVMTIKYGTHPGNARIRAGNNTISVSTAMLVSMTGHRGSTRAASADSSIQLPHNFFQLASNPFQR